MIGRRWPRALLLGIGTLVLALVCCVGGVLLFFFGGFNDNGNATDAMFSGAACGQGGVVAVDSKLPDIGSLTSDQIHNAAVIIKVGQDRQIPPRGWVVAIATALQESRMYNLPNLGARNDHDSVGLFQQRPSMGWGTPAQIMDPAYAAGKFYEHLVTVNGWQAMPLTVAAQAVQRSAFPDAYAKHEPLATEIVNRLANGAARAVGAVATLRCATGQQITASGWTVPVVGPITSGFRTVDRPHHNGDDIGAPKGTLIHAASAGVVLVVACQAHTRSGAFYGCDRDGSLQVQGCGWWLEIEHAGNVITRYCHMVSRPLVVVGQQVAAGQPIGRVGATGNVTGPHLHFEVHINGDDSSAGAVNPIAFMDQQGAPLGVQP
jgi:murein DD-endopeptidase MepM/ murein hydrolase activator NlpD